MTWMHMPEQRPDELKYKQCILIGTRKNTEGNLRQIVWVPSKFAVKGKILTFNCPDETWEVVMVYPKEAQWVEITDGHESEWRLG